MTVAAVRIQIRRLRDESASVPTQMTAGAAGCDVSAAISASLSLAPGARMLVPTGLAIAIPAGFEGQIRPRSGRAVADGLTVLNAPGTIDADYRGEVKVLLINLGEQPVEVRPGDRIAQLVIAPVVRVDWQEVRELPPSGRGAGGFGSTGMTGQAEREAR